MTVSRPVLRHDLFDSLPAADWRAVCALFDLVWPSEEGPWVDRAEEYRATKLGQQREVFSVWDGSKLLSTATVFPREIRTATGLRTVLALAAVCTDPERRGEGWGAAVVRAAFGVVDSGRFDVSLFQTPVPEFYAKFGAGPVHNPFVNSRWRPGDAHSAGAPWWDSHVMVYPASAEWPDGEIDLLGPGY